MQHEDGQILPLRTHVTQSAPAKLSNLSNLGFGFGVASSDSDFSFEGCGEAATVLFVDLLFVVSSTADSRLDPFSVCLHEHKQMKNAAKTTKTKLRCAIMVRYTKIAISDGS